MGTPSPPLCLLLDTPTRLFCEELQTCIPATMQPPWSAQPAGICPCPRSPGPQRGDLACFSDFCLETWAQGLFRKRLTFHRRRHLASRHTDSVSPS